MEGCIFQNCLVGGGGVNGNRQCNFKNSAIRVPPYHSVSKSKRQAKAHLIMLIT